ncbi:hypothetical protein FOL85_02350 [Lactobacillus reuteri]|uniref:hypothetical protein n=1 Tax=Limosilactobacillus reuteri TaxID=1598 RepID=UPI00146C072F|nr:hypothetical protein [Limosilactobacillus reuteri]NMV48347.1 hypothetical protein [Limosilactobacillus reuteri]NMV51067.1 hypothetical protein [Limosilactobacillus reuteri]NMV55607.1 hypothetical protein [Limosilactobacillus reuteri]NMV60392.1 hypothetical protein [Limosilactobacillus reuteri]NMV62185.1 hypothetical protein [Limosilactobacillus reuteri]
MDNNKLSNMLQHITSIRKSRATGVIVVSSDNINHAKSNRSKKREACRRCVLSGKRQCPFGIKYFYKGDEDWDPNIPQKGKEAEAGCVGCGWYDIEKWRQELNKQLEEDKNK